MTLTWLPLVSLVSDRVRTCLLFLGLICLTVPARADDDLDPVRGLWAEYESGSAQAQRVDPDLHFDWQSDSPHPLISPDGFKVRWQGSFLQREDQPVTFHAHLAGEFTLQIDGQIVMQASSESPAWKSGAAVTIPPGVHDVVAHFAKTGPQARLGLYWSSPAFPLEPVSTFQFFYEGDLTEWRLVERGEQLFESHRCNRCHARPGEEPAHPAPALWGVTEGLNTDWLISKLQGTHADAATSEMPHFGLSKDEATDIAVFLTRIGAPHELSPVPRISKGKDKLPTGRELLVSVGCLACHQVNDLGAESHGSGPNLARIGAKRSPEWLSTWLSQPEKLNPQHRMPVFKLTPTERALLVEELSNLKGDDDSVSFSRLEGSGAQGDRGKALIKALRCANCHKIPAIEIDVKGLSTLEQPVADWDGSCLASQPDRTTGRPVFPHADQEALKAYLATRAGKTLHRPSLFDQGKKLLTSRNCLACHERDGAEGIVPVAGQVAAKVPELARQSEALIPPQLTAVGDKLLDDWLTKAVSGEQREIRLPWLKVRMPQFSHSPEQKQALLHFLKSHDRIPDDAPQQLQLQETPGPDETLLVGRQLVGAGGFSCIACHKMGDYEPRNVAFGTRGSDLMNVAQRVRPEFFLRWTRSPLRIVPGMEMPSYLRPVKGVLQEDLDLQFSTLWGALSHPDFKAPTNPTQVEQFLVLQPGDRPRIVRDVFTLPGADKTPSYQGIARAFAVGFDNGHSLLLDLDNGRLRAWTYGDFARQRTEGKSWYWDMAGSLLSANSEFLGELAFLNERQELITPTPLEAGRLVSGLTYQHAGTAGEPSLQLRYQWHAQLGQTPVHLQVTEVLKPVTELNNSRLTGWNRELSFTGQLSSDLRPVITLRPDADARFQPQVTSSHPEVFSVEKLAADTSLIRFQETENGWQAPVAYRVQLPPYSPRTPVALSQPGLPGAAPVPVENSLLQKPVTTLPGYVGRRLNVPVSTMPTAMAFDAAGNLFFSSLKGHVYQVIDENGDGLEDRVTEFEEGLAAPFGVLPDAQGLLVAHKPELLRLVDADGDGRADRREVVADGWGYTDNYHDWTTGPVRDAAGRLYLALGSDYSQPDRPEGTGHWRGKVLRVNSDGSVDPIAHELRYPQGIAFSPEGRLFVTDQQGHGNPFNELNEIVEGRYYGVPARFDQPRPGPLTKATVQVPHPWTRSVNGVFFLPSDHPSPFAGHAIGCEYNGRFLIRYTLQEVGGELQGAVYPFTQPTWETDDNTFVGPICGTVAPNGDILIGSIHDSGWMGGLNTGEIVRLSRTREEFPNGIREVRAVKGTEPGQTGLAIDFIHPVPADRATDPGKYSLIGYTRVWGGAYATEDSGRHQPAISRAELSADRLTVTLWSAGYKPDHVYELRCTELAGEGVGSLFPDLATYSLNRLPQ